MSGNSFGRIFRVTSFGESHGKAVGVVVDGCPAGLALSEKDVQKELDKRKPGKGGAGTSRKEADKAVFLSGVFQGKTLGTPVAVLVENKNVDSSAYSAIKSTFRPGHADYSFFAKFGFRDWRGGGRSSGRETVARVAAGAVAKKVLEKFGVRVLARTVEAAGVEAPVLSLSDSNFSKVEKGVYSDSMRCADKKASKRMEEAVLEVKCEGDSTGGVVEVVALGVPAGVGEPVFGKLDASLASALMGIGAVKGVEVGAGFRVARMSGSECNDEFVCRGKRVGTKTNSHGGILGGISSGMPVVVRVAVKPASSIAVEQGTVDEDYEESVVRVVGRHDANICPRVVPVVEAMTALVLLDALMLQGVVPRRL